MAWLKAELHLMAGFRLGSGFLTAKLMAPVHIWTQRRGEFLSASSIHKNVLCYLQLVYCHSYIISDVYFCHFSSQMQKKIEEVDVIDNIYLILVSYRILLNLGSSAISSPGT